MDINVLFYQEHMPVPMPMNIVVSKNSDFIVRSK